MRIDASTVQISVAPTEEPISVSEAKTHLRVDTSDEDTNIDGLIEAARAQAEDISGRKFITQTLTCGLDRWPWDNVIKLPYLPIQSVTSVDYIDYDGNSNTLATSVYGVDLKRACIYLKDDQQWPVDQLRTYDPITITWVVGYGAATAVPSRYKQAIKLLVGHFHENREAVVVQQGVTMAQLPLAVMDLLKTDRAY